MSPDRPNMYVGVCFILFGKLEFVCFKILAYIFFLRNPMEQFSDL